MKAPHLILFWLIVVFPDLVFSQALNYNQPEGKVDNTFNPSDIGFGFGEGPDGGILSTAIQTDGKIIIAGNFTSYNGVSCNRIARLNMDGSLDMSFNPGTGAFNGEIRKIIIQSDGKIIAGGTFTLFNGQAVNRLIRLSTTGSIDSFNPAPNGDVNSLALQSDGKIIVGGNFTSFNSSARNNIVRINASGSLDAGFLGSGANGTINDIAIQSDGSIVIVGDFTQYSGTSRNRIARIFAGGTLDFSLNPALGANVEVLKTFIQSDGKILLSGNFTDYNGTSRSRVARINSDGTLDVGFSPGTGANNTCRTIVVLPDGKIVLGGSFTSFNGNSVGRIVKLNSNGSFDGSFASSVGANNDVYALNVASSELFIAGLFTTYNGVNASKITRKNLLGQDQYFDPGTGLSLNGSINKTVQQSDGKVIICGSFTSFNGVSRSTIARINSNGSVDVSFNAGSFFGFVYDCAVQSDGKIIVVGSTFSLNGNALKGIIRLNADGSIDSSFDADTGSNGVYNVLIDGTGKILISGTFVALNGLQRKGLARLNSNGYVDATFDPGLGVAGGNAFIKEMKARPDNKIVIVGDFTSYNAVTRNKIACINSNGTLDTSFEPSSGPNNSVVDVEIQSDNKILIAGYFTSYRGYSSNGIVRINTNGTTDLSFGVGGPTGGFISDLVTLSDGKMVVLGDFTSFSGVPERCVVRLTSAGLVDLSFNPNYGVEGEYGWEIAPVKIVTGIQLSNGKFLICGKILSYNGISVKSVAQLNSDGTLDFGFNKGPSSWSNGTVYSVAQQSDKKIVLGGSFTLINALTANKICRLNLDGTLDQTFNAGSGPDGIVRSVTIQQDGKILICGTFTTFSGVARKNIARLNSDGSLDVSFAPDPGSGTINAIALQNDGKVVLGGAFSSLNGSQLYNLGRVNTNGSLDASFVPGSGPNNSVTAVAIQTDGKILVSGTFSFYNGTSRARFLRINSSGSLDTGFQPGQGIQSPDVINTIVIDNNGKIMIGGTFTSYNGSSLANRIARIETNGTLDGTFNTTGTINGRVFAIAIQFDGKILVGGEFTTFNGTPTNRFVRVSAAGVTDNTLNYGSGSNERVYTVFIQPHDRKILIGGDFTSYNGLGKSKLARLIGPAFWTQLQFGAYCDGVVDETTSWEVDCDQVSGAIKYEWEFTNTSNEIAYGESSGQIIFLNQMPNFSYFAFGETYSVRVRAKDSRGWLDYGGKVCSLTVGNPSGKKPKTISEEISGAPKTNLSVYPNPSADIFHVSLSNEDWGVQKIDVIVYDMFGKSVVILKDSSTEFDLNLSDFQEGVYVLKAGSSTKSHYIRLVRK